MGSLKESEEFHGMLEVFVRIPAPDDISMFGRSESTDPLTGSY
jgi:hypothetical protein